MTSYEEIFDESYERVVRETRGDVDFFEAFYERFLDADPAVREKFRWTDMTDQRRILKKSFYSLVVFYVSGTPDLPLENIARSHSARGLDIRPELYDLWLECLVDTVREYDPQADDEIELAWRLVLSSGITYMKFQYNRC
ncbi:globin [Marinobacter sp.]|uniref:globin n=1 Tax=Marinobacter sp. TaxID=50741 RepID=UPI003850AC87